ncbi:MAG: hypothetical protein K6U04_02145 [Armatimonadetes bacterium]|jgi:hypothetical protein|nr:hypothetical protein [Armatimonadota bacterium]
MPAKVDMLLKEIDGLTDEEMRDFLNKIADRLELLGWLRVAEPAFSDWDNEEDAIYDNV